MAAARRARTAGIIEQVREDHLQADRPVGPFRPETVGAAVEAAIDVRAGASGEDARLQEQAWPRGGGQRFVAGTNGVDGRLPRHRQRVMFSGQLGCRGRGGRRKQTRGVHGGHAGRGAEHAGEQRLRHPQGLAGLDGAGAGAGQFRLGPRRLGPGPQLVVGEGPRRAGEDAAALDVGVGRGGCLLRGHHRQVGGTDRALHLEPGQGLAGPGPRDRGFGLADRGIALTQVERFPREQRADRVPQTLRPEVSAKRRPGDAGDDRLREQQAGHVVHRGAVGLPHRVEAQRRRARGVDVGAGGVHERHRGADGRVVRGRELERGVERQRLGRGRGLGGQLGRGGRNRDRDRQDESHTGTVHWSATVVEDRLRCQGVGRQARRGAARRLAGTRRLPRPTGPSWVSWRSSPTLSLTMASTARPSGVSV